MSALANDLEAGFEILWYKIESVLGRGGFGITYLATDTNLGQLVAIKEYLPHDFASRSGDSTVQPMSEEQEDMYSWGLERFMSEAQTLAKFKHHNIVRVSSVFKHNNTGYMVMDYEQGRALNDIFKEKKIFTQKELEDVYYPIMDGLAAVHKEGFIHRDIKPANIYIRDDGSPVLLDFGAARQAVGTKTRTLTSMLSIGYAPFEQYNDGSGKQGPWTDIYAIAACLHQGITGTKPIESTLRGMSLLHDEQDPYEPLSQKKHLKGYTHDFLRAIDQGLMLQIHDRPQTLDEFTGMLKGEIKLPDLPPRDKPEKPGINDRTIIRNVKGAFHGKDVPVTDDIATEKVTITEQLDEAPVKPKEIQADVVDLHIAPDTLPPIQPSTSRPRPKPGFNKTWLYAGGGLLAVIIVIAVILMPGGEKPVEPQPTQAITKQPVEAKTQEQRQQEKIDKLLAQGEDFFDAGTYFNDGSEHALNRFQQVLKLDQNNQIASKRLEQIAQQVMNNARASMSNKLYAKANSQLKAVMSIDPAFPGLKPMQQDLAQLLQNETKYKQVEILLNKAQQAMDAGQAYTPEQGSAYAYYRQVLAIDPQNITATLGMSSLSDQVLIDARNTLRNKEFAKTEKLVSLAETMSPGKPAIGDIRQELAKTSALKDLLAQADDAYAKLHYTTPENDSAVTLYNRILQQDPGNTHAISRLDKMADYYAKRIRSAVNSKNIRSAESNLNTLSDSFPKYSDLSRLQRDVSKLKTSLASKPTKPTISSSLIPAGVNQKQDDLMVVQDIIGLFLQDFKQKDLDGLKQVAQLNAQQQGLYNSLFQLYKSLNIKLVPGSFTVNKRQGVGSAKFQITDMVDKNGREVVTSANWTKIQLMVKKQNKTWLKAEVSNF